MLPQNISRKEIAQLKKFHLIFSIVKEQPVSILHAMMAGEVRENQPLITDTLKWLYQVRHHEAQFEDLMRISLLLYWYYQPDLPAQYNKADKKLYDHMAAKQRSWDEGFKGQSKLANQERLRKSVLEHPSGCVYQLIYDMCIKNPYGTLKELSIRERADILKGFKILLDCLEYMKAGKQQIV